MLSMYACTLFGAYKYFKIERAIYRARATDARALWTRTK